MFRDARRLTEAVLKFVDHHRQVPLGLKQVRIVAWLSILGFPWLRHSLSKQQSKSGLRQQV